MAATLSSPWGKPGAWALDAEEHEAELQQQEQEQEQQQNNSTETAEFPSLAAAAAAATKTKKKNKGQTFSLAEFNNSSAKHTSNSSLSKGLTHEDLLVLPTGPRQRSAEELDRSRLGGGFKSYGSNNRYGGNSFGSNNHNDEDSSNSRWGSSRILNRDSSRESQPSRADEIDNWAAAKKTVMAAPVRERGRGFFSDSHSKADESNSWVSNKTESNRSKFGFEKKSSFDSLSRGREGDRDNWGRRREENNNNNNNESERPRPRLLLQPRTVPVSSGPASAVKPKGVNPFGEARPREEVLAEKGKDWKEIDEKLDSVKIREEKSDTSSFGRRGFGNGRGGFAESRSWRKNESDSVNGTQQSSEDGDAEEKAENGDAEEKSENGPTEEN